MLFIPPYRMVSDGVEVVSVLLDRCGLCVFCVVFIERCRSGCWKLFDYGDLGHGDVTVLDD